MNHEEPVSFSNRRGQILKGILHRPAASAVRAGAVLCHGMESNKESEKLVALGRRLAGHGMLALRFDFSYASESSGKFEEITYSGEVEDLRAAFDLMLQYRLRKIGILGSSMGGTVALLFAAQEPRVGALITVAAPLHPEKITDRLLAAAEARNWHRSGFVMYHGRRINVSLLDDLQRIDVPEAARKISCPVLILHGDADDTVPVREAHELYAQLPGPKKICILEGVDHRFSNPAAVAEALDESVDWMSRHLQ